MEKELIPCYEQALRYLSIREHNVNELKTKLKQKKYDSYIIDKTIKVLLEEDYLSEERYIKVFIISNNRRHPEGKAMVLARLAQKGADKSLSNQIANQLYTPEYIQQLIDQAVQKIKKQGKEAEIRIKLARLGFLSADINRYMAESIDN